MNRISMLMVAMFLAGLLCRAGGAEEPDDHMALAKQQLVDVSRDYLAPDHPDWALCLDGPIVVIEQADCWQVQFALTKENAGNTAVVRIAKDTLQPIGLFHD